MARPAAHGRSRPAKTARESEKAKRYWAKRGVMPYYRQDRHWREFIAERVLEAGPKRVIEFGCNVGSNLRAIRERDPTASLVGLDINADAVDFGRREWGLDLRVGDEKTLEALGPDAADVLFTVSVVDHLADPDPMLRAAARAAPVLMLLEPWAGFEGRYKANGAAPYSYSWDVEARLKALGLEVTAAAYPLSEHGMGPMYTLFTARRVVEKEPLAVPTAAAAPVARHLADQATGDVVV